MIQVYEGDGLARETVTIYCDRFRIVSRMAEADSRVFMIVNVDFVNDKARTKARHQINALPTTGDLQAMLFSPRKDVINTTIWSWVMPSHLIEDYPGGFSFSFYFGEPRAIR